MQPIPAAILFITSTAITAGTLALNLQPGIGGGMDDIEFSTIGATDDMANKPRYSKSAYDITPLTSDEIKTRAEKLTDEQRRVLLNKGTEQAFCGNLLDNHKEGFYACALCGLPLFSSDSKFDSGSGWPSFFKPFDKDHIHYESDNSLGMQRVEILCARCTGHLGHLFHDGPNPTGLRYCLNSESLTFFEKGEDLPAESMPVATETAYFAGGCFWGVEDRFQAVPGVIDAVSGYQGGTVNNPTYKQVCYSDTGHAESVRVVFDPKRVSYRSLLEVFFKIHDPTTLNRQGPDIGDQYRSAIFTTSDEQLAQAKAYIAEAQNSDRFKSRKIVTQIEPAPKFYEAEEYHQDYHLKHGGSCQIPTP
ncbi:MAG: bifunctional methionine sulfoxide reductase B/A protein [Phycisphaerales bacterium]|nr:bifunctional methionine sulfoxide reductase B/A protein [Phycisphaerales bacterium]